MIRGGSAAVFQPGKGTSVKLRNSLFVVALGAGVGFSLGVAPGARAADTYKVDTVHSTVVFRIKHMNVSYFNGRFNQLSGTLTFDEQNPAGSLIDLKMTSDSIDTGDGKRDQHVKGPDFLNVKQFPTITFKSKQVSKSASGSFDVTGDLTLHGVTKPVTIKLEPTGTGPGMGGKGAAGFETVFTVKRSDFGMSNMIPMLGDEIRMTVDIEAGK
jgi:polyisoprenoid-binding protein YceI